MKLMELSILFEAKEILGLLLSEETTLSKTATSPQ